jgi:hypothetical protein
VIGDLLDVAEEAGKASFRIGKRNSFVKVRMEEAFFANSPNYQGLFYHAKDFLIENGSAIFTVIGEVQDRNAQGDYEVVVFQGDEFEIQGAKLLAIAASYSRGLFGT